MASRTQDQLHDDTEDRMENCIQASTLLVKTLFTSIAFVFATIHSKKEVMEYKISKQLLLSEHCQPLRLVCTFTFLDLLLLKSYLPSFGQISYLRLCTRHDGDANPRK